MEMKFNSLKPELWSASLEREILKSGGGSDGAPYLIAWGGSIINVTRRCAREWVKSGKVLSADSVRFSGNPSKDRNIHLEAAKQRAEKEGLDIQVKWNPDSLNYSISSRGMNCDYVTKNPTKEISILLGEWTEVCEAYGMEAEIAAEKIYAKP